MKSQVKLVESINKDMIVGLEALLKLAKEGNITGMVYGVKHGRHSYSLGALGCLSDKPYSGKKLAEQLVRVLDDKAQELEFWD